MNKMRGRLEKKNDKTKQNNNKYVPVVAVVVVEGKQ